MTEHLKRSVVKTVNGYDIRPVSTRFGRLYAIVGTRVAHPKLEKAVEEAGKLPPAQAAA